MAGMLALLGPVVALGYLAHTIRRHAKKSTGLEERSTTSSAGGGAAAYETRKAVSVCDKASCRCRAQKPNLPSHKLHERFDAMFIYELQESFFTAIFELEI